MVFDVHKQIISNIRDTNIVSHNESTHVLDAQRMVTLWEIICDENDSQLHLVNEKDKSFWLGMKNGINKQLEEAQSPEDIIACLGQLIRSVGTVAHQQQYNGMYADVYSGMAHVSEEELKRHASLR